jgi:hypothetical protein
MMRHKATYIYIARCSDINQGLLHLSSNEGEMLWLWFPYLMPVVSVCSQYNFHVLLPLVYCTKREKNPDHKFLYELDLN